MYPRSRERHAVRDLFSTVSTRSIAEMVSMVLGL